MYSIRRWIFRPKKTDTCLAARFFYADEELNAVAAELDSFDGRREPERCTALVHRLRRSQDAVLGVVDAVADAVLTRRCARDFRVKFPDDVLHDSLAGQLWFGAECLAAGSSIMNREIESASMRPLAKAVTRQLDYVRSVLRDQCLRNLNFHTDKIYNVLGLFDRLFAEFELSYVSAMVPVKTMREYDVLQEVIVLFSETVQRSLGNGLLTQDMLDDCDPVLMFTIPRLAIVCGLLVYPDGPLNPDIDPVKMSEMFRTFQTLLYKIRELLWTLTAAELVRLERALCSRDDLVDPSPGPAVSVTGVTGVTGGGSGVTGGGGVTGSGGGSVGGETNVVGGQFCDYLHMCDADRHRPAPEPAATPPPAPTVTVAADVFFGHHARRLRHSISWPERRRAAGQADGGERRDACPLHQRMYSPTDERQFSFHLPLNTTTHQALCTPGVVHAAATTGGATATAPLAYVTPALATAVAMTADEEASRDSDASTGGDDASLATTTTTTSEDGRRACACGADGVVEGGSAGGSPAPLRPRAWSLGGVEEREAPAADADWERDSCSSSATSSYTSEGRDPEEISLAVEAAELAARRRARARFTDSDDLIHRLFVCISGVADQLQTNYAGDLRHILKCVFECNASSPPPEDEERVAAEDDDDRVPRPADAPPSYDTADDIIEDLLDERDSSSYHGVSRTQSFEEPPVWVADADADECTACDSLFTFVKRRHHCRNCGQIFCGRCSQQSVALPHFGHLKPVRVCDSCFTFTAASSQHSPGYP